MGRIVHISNMAAWDRAVESGEYRAESLNLEGFIHCSRMEQILKVANTYYPKQVNLKLMWIDTGKLTAELKWEESDGDIFPHLYGQINLDAVIGLVDFPLDSEGVFVRVPQPE